MNTGVMRVSHLMGEREMIVLREELGMMYYQVESEMIRLQVEMVTMHFSILFKQ